jgi:hypothetical protein
MPIYFLTGIPLGSWSMMVVQIEKPANMKLAMWFTELRSWFDKNNCQPVAFTPSGSLGKKLNFKVAFSDDSQARLFASSFPMYVWQTGEHKEAANAGITDRELGRSPEIP